MKRAPIFLALLLTAAIALPTRTVSAGTVIRFATSAPDGSLQAKVMKAMARKISKATGGEVTFKLFTGGTMGDDLGVISRMKLGRIDAAGFSGVGTGEILPESRLFELPFMFSGAKQVDCVRAKMQAYFEKRFADKGFVLLGWADPGAIYLFSKKRIGSVGEMAGTKPWVWKGDPIGEMTFKVFGLSPTPLQLQDVLTSLQTGLIDTFYVTPALAIALQWNTYATYMVDAPLVQSLGTVLIKKDSFDKLTAEQQAQVRAVFAQWMPKLLKKTRKENKKSIVLLMEQGLKKVTVPPAELKKFREKGREVAEKLTGKLYSAELLKQMEGYIGECR